MGASSTNKRYTIDNLPSLKRMLYEVMNTRGLKKAKLFENRRSNYNKIRLSVFQAFYSTFENIFKVSYTW